MSAIQRRPIVLSNRLSSIGAIGVGNFNSTERTATSVIVDNSTTKDSNVLEETSNVFNSDAEIQIGDNELSVAFISTTNMVGDRGESLMLRFERSISFLGYRKDK